MYVFYVHVHFLDASILHSLIEITHLSHHKILKEFYSKDKANRMKINLNKNRGAAPLKSMHSSARLSTHARKGASAAKRISTTTLAFSLLHALIFAGVGIFLASCSAPTQNSENTNTSAQDKLPVSASFYPIAWLTEHIGGDAVSVSSITPANDVALAMLFYGGIAGGVILIRIAGGSTTNLTSYLFGSIATVSTADVWYTIGLATVILLVGIGLRGPLFALSYDPEFSRARGL